MLSQLHHGYTKADGVCAYVSLIVNIMKTKEHIIICNAGRFHSRNQQSIGLFDFQYYFTGKNPTK